MTLSDEGLDLLFRNARTHNVWLDRPVSDETLRQLYDVMKWGPTSANSNPARIIFIRTREAKERFLPAGHVKSNFLCNLGYGDASKLFPRLPRLSFAEACALM